MNSKALVHAPLIGESLEAIACSRAGRALLLVCDDGLYALSEALVRAACNATADATRIDGERLKCLTRWEDSPESFCLPPASPRAAWVGEEGATIFDLEKGKVAATIKHPPQREIVEVHVSPGGRKVAALVEIDTGPDALPLYEWHACDGESPVLKNVLAGPYVKPPALLCWMRSEISALFSDGRGDRMFLLNLQSGRETAVNLPGGNQAPTAGASAPDGRVAVSADGGTGGEVYLAGANLSSWQRMGLLGQDNDLTVLDFSPKGRWLLLANDGPDGEAVLVAASDLSVTRQLVVSEEDGVGAAWLFDDEHVVWADQQRLRLFRVAP